MSLLRRIKLVVTSLALVAGANAVPHAGESAPPPPATMAETGSRPEMTTAVTNLRGYWTRVFNCFTDSGENRRVTTIMFGDSLGGRLAGWLQLQIGESYAYGSRGRALGNAGPLWNGGWGPASGVPHQIYGPGTAHDVVKGNPIYQGGWLTGAVFDIEATGTLQFPAKKQFGSDLASRFGVYYVAQPGAGTFVLEFNSADAEEGWKQVGEPHDADGKLAGAVASAPLPQRGKYWFRARVTSGTVRFIGGWFDDGSNAVRGVTNVSMTAGGLSISNSALVEREIVAPVMAHMAPCLVTVHFDDLDFVESLTTVLSNIRAGAPDCSCLVIANHAKVGQPYESTQASNRALKAAASRHDFVVFDALQALGSADELIAAGWQGDGIHLDPKAYFVGGQLLIAELDMVAQASPVGHRSFRGVSTALASVGELTLGGGDGVTALVGTAGSAPPARLTQDGTYNVWADIGMQWTFRDAREKTPLLRLSTNEFTANNLLPSRFFMPNAEGGEPAKLSPYASLKSGVTHWTFGNLARIRRNDSGAELSLGPLVASSNLDLPTVEPRQEHTALVKVDGVSPTAATVVQLGWSAALPPGLLVKQAWVSASDTVSIAVFNSSDAATNAASLRCHVAVMELIAGKDAVGAQPK